MEKKRYEYFWICNGSFSSESNKNFLNYKIDINSGEKYLPYINLKNFSPNLPLQKENGFIFDLIKDASRMSIFHCFVKAEIISMSFCSIYSALQIAIINKNKLINCADDENLGNFFFFYFKEKIYSAKIQIINMLVIVDIWSMDYVSNVIYKKGTKLFVKYS